MPFCRSCGGELTADARICSHCGESPEAEPGIPDRVDDDAVHDWADVAFADRPALTQNERTTALFCHLATFAGFVIPLGNIIAPLVLWRLRRYDSPYIDHHGKEAVNFQISMTIYVAVSAVLILLLVGIPLLFVIGMFGIVMTMIAAAKASNGIEYRYPLAIRLVK